MGDNNTLLLLNPDPFERELLRRLFAEGGYRVIVVEEGSRLMTVVRTQAPAVAVLADRRHDAEYLTILRWMRTQHNTATVPVLTLVRDQDLELACAAYDAGSNMVLFTPVDLTFLCASVGALIRCDQAAVAPWSVIRSGTTA